MRRGNNDFETGVDERLSGIFMFFFSLPFACVPLIMAVFCYWSIEQFYYGWIDFSDLIFRLGFFLLFMITFGVVGFGMLIGSFNAIVGEHSDLYTDEENFGSHIIEPIVDNEWWKSLALI